MICAHLAAQGAELAALSQQAIAGQAHIPVHRAVLLGLGPVSQEHHLGLVDHVRLHAARVQMPLNVVHTHHVAVDVPPDLQNRRHTGSDRPAKSCSTWCVRCADLIMLCDVVG